MRGTIKFITVVAAIAIANTASAYDPQGREEFVFSAIPTELQKYGYEQFCPSTRSFRCMDRLPYEKYYETKGYFLSDAPENVNSYSYDFYKVVLESDEEYFYVVDKRLGKYGLFAPIIPLSKYQELKSFKPRPLVSGSSLELTSVTQIRGTKNYSISNGSSINEDKLNLIQEVTSKFGGKASLAELLLDVNIEKDNVEDRYFIEPVGDILRSEAKLYIGAKNKKVWLRFKVKYYSDDWLFVESYKVAADKYRWQSPKQTFQRDHTSGSIWEWIDVPANRKEIEVAKALSEAKNATIRFIGDQYYSDEMLADDQKQSIKKILHIYKEMGGK